MHNCQNVCSQINLQVKSIIKAGCRDLPVLTVTRARIAVHVFFCAQVETSTLTVNDHDTMSDL